MATKRSRTVDVGFLKETESEPDLSALFAQGMADTATVEQIPPDRLLDNPYQPRVTLEARALNELADVIREQGFQGALVARPHPSQPAMYQLAFGHRRREAAKRAGLATVPIMVRAMGEEEMAEIAITENIQRADLTPLEEGKTFATMNAVMGYTYEQIAASIGKTRGYVENRLRVARAPEDVQALVTDKPDSLRAVATLIRVKDAGLRGELIAQLRTGRLTADDLAGYLQTAGQNPPSAPPATPEHPSGEPVGQAAASPNTVSAAVTATTRRDAEPSPPSALAAAMVADPAANLIPARLGNGHLATALRALGRFDTAAQERESISPAEFSALTDVKRLAESLYTRYSATNSGS